ncbi:MAG: DUF5818 domain-containing protein [Candidatus Acidiferrales bacterium]|jgi:hypothetical protein
MMNINIGAGAFAVILAMGSMGFASAQDSATTKPTIHNSTHTLTGCLQKGDDEYVLASDDGSIWELTGNSVKLDGQIGHTVTITGVVFDPAVHGTKVNMKGEIKGHGGYGHVTVTKLTLVGDTCERNS